ncbi:universal stress protein [Candidatus Nitrosotenuis sp. DW1]|uniref:universal stress protein n=1 Tax=Candidatus Nitrosotenuis sp. DW1 TaxID=2259672 RepID=UPI0015CD64F8|nr:universal stress protein [Candidatus Nitrosotenuis sp. DW1]QLH09035.1 universal stress protein [Candidatus Nitrosotenuis sp. DW1]
MATKKINKILAPLDGSANSLRGLQNAITFAKQFDAEITGLYVVNIPAAAAIRISPEMRKKEIRYAESIIDEATKMASRNGVAFKPKIETGDPGDRIVRTANTGHFDLVVIGSRGRGAAKEIFLGSTSNHVLHKTNVPVVVVK